MPFPGKWLNVELNAFKKLLTPERSLCILILNVFNILNAGDGRREQADNRSGEP